VPQRVRVLCINKFEHHDPHERILYIGGVDADGYRWKLSQRDAINSIKNSTRSFYVSAGGHIADVVIAIHNGNEYLKMQPDATGKDNLLSLPECP
jgi:hypothetical protein